MLFQSLAVLSIWLYASVDAAPTTGSILSDTQTLVSSSTELDRLNLTGCSLQDIFPPLSQTSTRLSAPASNSTLAYVVLGRGTQNYTCADSSDVTKPTPTGALATMFDVSCLADNVDLLSGLAVALLKLPHDAAVLASLNLKQLTASATNLVVAEHFFTDSKTAVFDFRPFGHPQWAQMEKLEAVDAPPTAINGSVQWLKLGYKSGQGIHQVYRTLTAGGSPPATCKGQQPDIVVDYAAAYYFYT